MYRGGQNAKKLKGKARRAAAAPKKAPPTLAQGWAEAHKEAEQYRPYVVLISGLFGLFLFYLRYTNTL